MCATKYCLSSGSEASARRGQLGRVATEAPDRIEFCFRLRTAVKGRLKAGVERNVHPPPAPEAEGPGALFTGSFSNQKSHNSDPRSI